MINNFKARPTSEIPVNFAYRRGGRVSVWFCGIYTLSTSISKSIDFLGHYCTSNSGQLGVEHNEGAVLKDALRWIQALSWSNAAFSSLWWRFFPCCAKLCSSTFRSWFLISPSNEVLIKHGTWQKQQFPCILWEDLDKSRKFLYSPCLEWPSHLFAKMFQLPPYMYLEANY